MRDRPPRGTFSADVEPAVASDDSSLGSWSLIRRVVRDGSVVWEGRVEDHGRTWARGPNTDLGGPTSGRRVRRGCVGVGDVRPDRRNQL